MLRRVILLLWLYSCCVVLSIVVLQVGCVRVAFAIVLCYIVELWLCVVGSYVSCGVVLWFPCLVLCQ